METEPNCAYDFLEISYLSSGTGRTWSTTLCGSKSTPITHILKSNTATLNFKSDASQRQRGFKLQYSTVPASDD